MEIFDFKFKIKLIPIKRKNYTVRPVLAGRISKICFICNKRIEIGKPSVNFIEINKSGFKKIYQTKYACGNLHSVCSIEAHKKLL